METVFIPEGGIIDSRLTEKFYAVLQDYMKGPPEKWDEADKRYYKDWWCDHAGRRSEWFRNDLLWRLERDQPLAGRRVLDFGCGSGSSTAVFGEAGAEVVAVEPEAEPLKVNRQRIIDLGLADRVDYQQIPYLSGGDEELDLQSGSFDVITLTGVLEHMLPPEREHCVREAHRLLKPGGEVFIFDTPNRQYPFDFHTTRLWFLGWMPLRLALRYAKLRRRVPGDLDMEGFCRRGANGISRRTIDRLFDAKDWELSYDRPPKEGLHDTGNLSNVVPLAPERFQNLYRKFFRFIGRIAWGATRMIGLRPVFLHTGHVMAMRKRGK